MKRDDLLPLYAYEILIINCRLCYARWIGKPKKVIKKLWERKMLLREKVLDK